MADEFKVHRLNDQGMQRATEIARAFDACLTALDKVLPQGRERALVITKLQESNFWAKRGIAIDPANQEE